MSSDNEKLSTALRRMVDDNRAWLEQNGLIVPVFRVEENKKYGTQLVIIVRPEGKDER